MVNGTTIVRETHTQPIFIYYHIELDYHSLILAENVPTETFIDNVDRFGFDNWDEHEALYPEGKILMEMSYPGGQGPSTGAIVGRGETCGTGQDNRRDSSSGLAILWQVHSRGGKTDRQPTDIDDRMNLWSSIRRAIGPSTVHRWLRSSKTRCASTASYPSL